MEIPTLDEFTGVATRQFWRLKYPVGTIFGPNGPVKAPFLERDDSPIIVPLPNIPPDEKLSLNEIRRIIRNTKITGYESLMQED